MAVWEPQGVWLALGEQVRGIHALPPPFQRSGCPEGGTPTEACLKSLCSEPRLGPLEIHNIQKCSFKHKADRKWMLYKNKTLPLRGPTWSTTGNTWAGDWCPLSACTHVLFGIGLQIEVHSNVSNTAVATNTEAPGSKSRPWSFIASHNQMMLSLPPVSPAHAGAFGSSSYERWTLKDAHLLFFTRNDRGMLILHTKYPKKKIR